MARAPFEPRRTQPSDRSGDTYSALRFWLALVLFAALAVTLVMAARLYGQRERLLAQLTESRGARGRLPAQFVKAEGELKLLTRFAGGLAVAELVLLTLSALQATRYVSRARRDAAALRASERFARATLDALPAQIAILDQAGVVLAVNRSWRLFDAGDQVIERVPEGRNFLAICDAATGRRMREASSIAAAVRRVLRGVSEQESLETAGHGARGDAWYLCRVGRFASEGSDAPAGRVVVAFEDITQRVRAEEEVRRAKEAADAASAAKSAFLANMSHEIRTPMSAVLGYAELLQDPRRQATPEERDRALTIIRRNGEHLLAIINDILDLSKIEAGKLVLERTPTPLPQLVADVALLVRQRAEQRGLRFEVVCDGPVPRTVTTDPLRLRQVLINLLGNAIKFTTHGGVTLRVACEPTLSGSIVHFDVIDTGIGMPPEQVARLFQPFMQGDESATRRFGGTGLGLSISRRLANLLGGDIAAQSESGRGTTFSVWIAGGRLDGVGTVTEIETAAAAADEAGEDRDAATGGPGAARREPPAVEPSILRIAGRVLLVEDGEDNRDLLQVILRDAGLEVRCAENGQAGVELAESDPEIGLILMDMQMPEMDGYTATRLLRARGYGKPIVALTANAMTDDRKRCLDAGCDEYCSKPVNRSRLLAIIARLMSPGGSAAAPVAAVAHAAGVPIRSTRAVEGRMSAMLLRFVERLPARVREIESLLDREDSAGLQRVIHQLKGAAGGYGFPQISELAQAAEDRLRTASSLEHARSQVHQLVALVRSVQGYPAHDAPRPAEVKPAVASPSPSVVSSPAPPEPARTDPITGLPNKAYAKTCLASEFSRSRRAGAPLTCVLFSAGEPAGASPAEQQHRAIQAARVLQTACGDSFVARWGERQFLVALSGCDEPAAAEAARALVDRLQHAVPGVTWSTTVRQASARVGSAARFTDEMDVPDAAPAAGTPASPLHVGAGVDRPLAL